MEDTGKGHLAQSASAVGKPQPKELPQDLRHRMETSFGADLSAVRVHESHAPTMLGVNAFTKGNDLFFAPGKYAPHTPEGEQMISHELTHVVQQCHPKPTE